MPLTRFSVPPLHQVTRTLAAVAMGRAAPDLVITGARLLSTYTDRIHPDREVWVKSGRIAVVKPAGSFQPTKGAKTKLYDARGGILAPGVCNYIEQATGRTTRVWNPLEGLRVDSDRVNVEELEAWASTLVVALGLASRVRSE